MADGGDNLYPIDKTAVRLLAEQLRASAGDTAGDFVFCAIDDTGMTRHVAVPNDINVVEHIAKGVSPLGVEFGNIYHCMSLFRSGSVTEFAGRTRENVILVLGAVCDFDQKNDPATRHKRLPFAPSAEVETSHGNFQCHYWFDHALPPDEAGPLLAALADVAKADSCKTIEHLWRTPGTYNLPTAKKIKEGRDREPFLTRWTIPPDDWNRISADELRNAIVARDPQAFDASVAGRDAEFDWDQRKKPGDLAKPLTDQQIAIALSKEGDKSALAFTLIRRLQRANYSAEDIVAVLLKFSTLPVMGHYGASEDRVRADVRRAFGKPDQPSFEKDPADAFRDAIDAVSAKAPLRTIKIFGGALAKNVDEVEAALREQKVSVYQRGSFLVRRGEVIVKHRNGKSTKEELIVQVTQPALIEIATGAANIVRWDARMADWKEVNCPKDVAEAYLARVGLWNLRPLMGVINAPTLRPDGTLLDQPGYDEKTGLIYDPRGVTFPVIPSQPSRDDALAALAVLDELIHKFPFVSREARAVALAAFLTSVVRRTLEKAPLFGIDGTGAGSGKGLLADTISIVGTGKPAQSLTAGENEAELEKRIGSALLSGVGCLSIDNLTRPLDSDFLASILTQLMPAIRILGKSKLVNVPTNALLFATGNNLSFAGDMWRRVLTCSIDPQMERPGERKFSFDPTVLATEKRGRYVAAALTILRAYQVAGAPAQKGRVMGSYEEYARIVRDPLLWLGEADPVLTVAPPADDPERERFGAVVLGWQALIGEGRGVTLKEAIHLAAQAATGTAKPELLDAFHAVAAPMVRGVDTRVDGRRLGEWMRGKKRQVIHGLRFFPAGERGAGLCWRLERVQGRAE